MKAITRPDGDEPEQEKRRRRGETEGEFRRLARYLRRRFDARRSFKLRAAIASRFAPIDPQVHATATEYLPTTLDIQLNDGNGSNYGDEFDAISDYPQSLHL